MATVLRVEITFCVRDEFFCQGKYWRIKEIISSDDHIMAIICHTIFGDKEQTIRMADIPRMIKMGQMHFIGK